MVFTRSVSGISEKTLPIQANHSESVVISHGW